MKNNEIARLFRTIAQMLEVKGENVFRIRAYQRAADQIESLTSDISLIASQGKLTDIPGIGKDLAGKISEYLTTGKIAALEELTKIVPEGVLELLEVPSIGPKTAQMLYKTLHLKSIAELNEAIQQGRLNGLPGIKEKSIENIQEGIQIVSRGRERMTVAQADLIAADFLKELAAMPEVHKISVAGSLRRMKETVRDIDLLVVSNAPKKVMATFTHLPLVAGIIAEGQTKSSVRTNEDVQVDCRLVQEESFGAALLYFTGSKDFNIALRQRAQKRGLKINEYGVFRGTTSLAGRSEEEIFRLLKMRYIEPELRENRGEIQCSINGQLPELVNLTDIKGDLHCHSLWSDGINTIEEMAEAAKAMGYAYIALTDHSQSLRVANGLRIPDLKKKREEIEAVQKRLKNFSLLYATEVDIASDGSIDYPDEVLKEFDLVVAAIHTGFKQTPRQLTRRLISACRHPSVHIIAHPTGRLWGMRQAYEFDLDEVFETAAKTNTHFEINAHPQRLDLNDIHCRKAKEYGIKLAISTDSHSTDHLGVMKYGVAVARRGWLGAGDVLNTLPIAQLRAQLRKPK